MLAVIDPTDLVRFAKDALAGSITRVFLWLFRISLSLRPFQNLVCSPSGFMPVTRLFDSSGLPPSPLMPPKGILGKDLSVMILGTYSRPTSGSIKTATTWKTWNSAITCLQETRIGKNCINNAKHTVAQCGKTLFPGALLPGLFASNGVMRTPHGGVAIAAPAELCIPFLSKDDNTGKYIGLFNTKRVQAVWIQITPTLEALVFNVYCKTAASQDRDVLHFNNGLLADIFAVASQFGDIPVFIAGDFPNRAAPVRICHLCC